MDTKVTMGKVADHCERLIREKEILTANKFMAQPLDCVATKTSGPQGVPGAMGPICVAGPQYSDPEAVKIAMTYTVTHEEIVDETGWDPLKKLRKDSGY
jgi:hypothetical protein